jgi:hypothetical protein
LFFLLPSSVGGGGFTVALFRTAVHIPSVRFFRLPLPPYFFFSSTPHIRPLFFKQRVHSRYAAVVRVRRVVPVPATPPKKQKSVDGNNIRSRPKQQQTTDTSSSKPTTPSNGNNCLIHLSWLVLFLDRSIQLGIRVSFLSWFENYFIEERKETTHHPHTKKRLKQEHTT